MRKLFFVLLAVLFLSGCGTAARESGFYENNTMYRNWDHLKFSVWGYKQVDKQETQLSKEQQWWGIPANKVQ